MSVGPLVDARCFVKRAEVSRTRFMGIDSGSVGSKHVKGLGVTGVGQNSWSSHTERDFAAETSTPKGSNTRIEDKDGVLESRTWTSIDTEHQRNLTKSLQESLSRKRRFSLQLPSFEAQGISLDAQSYSDPERDCAPRALPGNRLLQVNSAPVNSTGIGHSCGGLGPLTPPPEDLQAAKTLFHNHTKEPSSGISATTQADTVDQGSNQTEVFFSRRMQGITLPERPSIEASSQVHTLPWIVSASHEMLTSLNSTSHLDVLQVVSQTLPSQAKDGRSRPTFEEVLEVLQSELNTAPYITITHAAPQARIMEELPKTPPSTPNSRHETLDYFGGDQTIFSNAAVVPIYHSHDRTDHDAAGRFTHHIAAPCSVQVSILERYIPPTMPKEVEDFFSASTRSYLADRLLELSTNKGSLLLVYPTRNGANTFARRYVSPIIDPCLRRFVMLNGLTSDAAALLGNMTAVNQMMDFEEMKTRIDDLCRSISQRPGLRGSKSAFNISFCETSNVILERSTWMNWYVEQEQSRLRQNLVQYHQAGGRMPEAEGNREITVGMLVRDLIEGIKKSQEPAGGSEIEVGVFLITRSSPS